MPNATARPKSPRRISNYLYSDEGQEIAAKNFYRPRNEAVAAKYAANFSQLKLVTVDQEFGGWPKAQKTHFADGGMFDQIYQPEFELIRRPAMCNLRTKDRSLLPRQTAGYCRASA